MVLLRFENVSKTFRRGSGPYIHAVSGVSFQVESGETLAIIGESGSGKSTVGRLALGLSPASAGKIEFDGIELGKLSSNGLRSLRPKMQIVFQEPFQSLNPRLKVRETVEEPLIIHDRGIRKDVRRDRVLQTLDQVGLPEDIAGLYPRALSGGQQQRVGIARAIVTRPKLVVLDEPTSSLDLSVRAQILNLLRRLQQDFGLAYVFISHDIATVRHISRRVAVMYRGQFLEVGPASKVMDEPKHPYTKALLSASLSPDPDVSRAHYPLKGEIPDPTIVPSGCYLCGRCSIEMAECSARPVPLQLVSADHSVACIAVDGYARVV